MILKPKHSLTRVKFQAGDVCTLHSGHFRNTFPKQVEIVGFDVSSNNREVLIVLGDNEEHEYPWSNSKILEYELYEFSNKEEANSLMSPYVGRVQTWVNYSELVFVEAGSKEYTLEQLLFRL